MPYCQQAPKNAELNGLFQCQFQSADEQTFVGGTKAGGQGTVPFGLSSSVSPAGSCPANPSGPVPDGQQLVTITQDPGLNNISGSSGGDSNASATASAAATDSAATSDAPAASSAATSSDDSGDCGVPATVTVTGAAEPTSTAVATDAGSDASSDAGSDATATVDDTGATATAAVASAAASSSSATASSGSGGFQLQNGQDAQAQNAKFASLTADASCNGALPLFSASLPVH